MTRKLEYLPLDSLTFDPRNPKAHDFDTLGASVHRFGYVEPVVRDERTGYIISGHGRTQALLDAQAAGQEPPEGVQVSEDGAWLVPTVTGWASRSDSDAHAALIALNRTGERGGWEDEALLSLLEELEETEDGFAGVGFGEEDIDALRALTQQVEEVPRDLDLLAEEFGDMTEEDGLRRVVLSLDPEVADALRSRLDEHEGDENAAVRSLLGI